MELLKAVWNMPAGIWRGMMASAPFRLWAQAGAAAALTLFAAGIVLIIWRGPWTLAVEAKRVDGLVVIALAGLFLVLIALVALTELQVSLRATRSGVEANMVGEDHELAPVATTTTTTTTVAAPVAAAPPADAGELPASAKLP